MKSIDELPGTLVLIRSEAFPELHNKIGTIVSELLDDSSVMVKTKSHAQISFSAHELWVMKEPEEIEKYANWDQEKLPFWNYADIMEAAMSANSRFKEETIAAIELSAKDPDVMEYTMDTLAHELGITRTQTRSR